MTQEQTEQNNFMMCLKIFTQHMPEQTYENPPLPKKQRAR